MAVPEAEAEAAAVAAAAAALGRKGLVATIHTVYDADRHSKTEMFVLVNKLAKMHIETKLFVISAIKEGQNDDPEQAKYVMFYRAPIESNILQAMRRETIDIVDKLLLPFSRAAENTVLCTNTKADAYSFLAMLKVEEDNKQLLNDKALTDYEATSKAAESLFAVHALRHALHLTKTALFSDVKEWPEMATALAKLALGKAGPEFASLDEGSYKKIAETIGIMEDNLKTAEIMGLTDEKLKLWEPTSPNNSKDYSEPSSENSISPKLLEEEPSYSGGSPSPPPPVVPCPTGPPVPPKEFTSPGDWGYEVHEVLMSREIQFRKKAAQMKRGFMG